ncbi:Hypothetical predicted protein [Mytilus galloprovincialis]|uniref:SEA domain-containing protein n=1 Tax=Mytilus galloprovincialis TaxID=29158 RepID=A0A8B6BJQ1_MYTGA|nr:Hypothetical predicted protein [Mytilus galloprovincialis]
MNGRERRNRGRYSEWPHMTTLYNSNSRITEAGNNNDVPLSTIENSFEPPNSHGYFRYNGHRNDTLDSVISEGISSRPPSFKHEEDERASSYELGDKFKRGSTCRVILCIFFVLCFIGVVIAGVVLSVLQTFESTATLNNATFTEALTDVNSPQFHKLAKDFCEAMKAMFTSSSSPFIDDYEDCEVLSFRPGSVKVRFRLGSKIYSEVNMETILGQFKNHLQNMITREGPWNPLRIDETTILNFKEVEPRYRIKYSSQFKMWTEKTLTENLLTRYIQSSLKEKEIMSSQRIIESTEIEPSPSLDNFSSIKVKEVMSSQRIIESTEIEPSSSLGLSYLKEKEIMSSKNIIESTEIEPVASLDNLTSLKKREIMSSQRNLESTKIEPSSSLGMSPLKEKKTMSLQNVIESTETGQSSSLENLSSLTEKEIMFSQRIIESTEIEPSLSLDNLFTLKEKEIMSSQRIIESTETEPSSSLDNLSSLKVKEIMSSQRIIESTETEPSSSHDNLTSLKEKEIMSSQRNIESTETEPSSSLYNFSSLKEKDIMSPQNIIESTETEPSSSLDDLSSLKEKEIVSSQRIIESTETEPTSSLENLSSLKAKNIMSSQNIIESTETGPSSYLENLSSLKEKEIMSSQRIIESTEIEPFSSLDNLSSLKEKEIMSPQRIIESTKNEPSSSYISEYVGPKTYIQSSSVLNSFVSSYADNEITTVDLFNDEISKSKIKTGLTMLYSTELSTRRFKMSHETTYSYTILTSIVSDKLSNDFLHTEKYQLEYMESETHSLNSAHATKLYITPDMVVTSTLMFTSDSSVFSMPPKDFQKIDASQVYVDTSSARDQSKVGLEELNNFSTQYQSSFSGSGHSNDIISSKTDHVTETINNNIQVYSDNVTRTFNQTRPDLQFHTTTAMYSGGSSQLTMLSSLSLLNTPVNVNTSDNFDFISSKLTLDGDEFRKASVSSTNISPDKTMSMTADNIMHTVASVDKRVSFTVEPSSVEGLTSSLPERITNSTTKYISQSALPLNKTTWYLSTTSIFTDPSSPLTILYSSDTYASVSTTINLETTFVDVNQQSLKPDLVTKMEQTFEKSSMPYVGSMTETGSSTSEFPFHESTYLRYMQQVVSETSIAFQSSNEYKQDSAMRLYELSAMYETESTMAFSDKNTSNSTQELRPSSSAEVAYGSYVYVSPDTLLSEIRTSIAIDKLYSFSPDPPSDHRYLQSSQPTFSTMTEQSFTLVKHVSSEVEFSSTIYTFSAEYSDSSDIMRNIGSSLISSAIDEHVSVTDTSSISNSLYGIQPNITNNPITEKLYVTKLKPEIENEIFINETWIILPVDDSYSSKLIITPQKEQMISSQIISKQLDMMSSRESESQHSLISLDNQHTKSLTFESVDSSAATKVVFNLQLQSQVQENTSIVDSMTTLAVESSILQNNEVDFSLYKTVNTTLSKSFTNILSHKTSIDKPINMYIEPTTVLKATTNVDELFATRSVIFESLNRNSSKLFLSETKPVPEVITNVLTSYVEEQPSLTNLKTSIDSAELASVTSFIDLLSQQESGITDHFDSTLLSTEIIASVLIGHAENNTSNTFSLPISNSSIYNSSTASTINTVGSLYGPMPPMTVVDEPISEEWVLIEPVDISLLSEKHVSSNVLISHSSIEKKESSNTQSAAVDPSWTNSEKYSLLFADMLLSEANILQPVVSTPSFYNPSNIDLYTTFSINEETDIADVSSSSLIKKEKLESKFQTFEKTFTSLLQSKFQTAYAMDQLFPSESPTTSHVSDKDFKTTRTIADTAFSTEKNLQSDFNYVAATSITLNKGESILEGNQSTEFILKSTKLAERNPVDNTSSNFVVASQYDNIPSIRSYMISSSDFPSEPLSMMNSIDQIIEGTIVSKIQMSPDRRYFSSITKDNISHIPTDHYTYSNDVMASSSITSNMQLLTNGNIPNKTPFEQTLKVESMKLLSDAFQSSVQKEEIFKTEFNEINMHLITPSQIQNVQESSLSSISVFAVNVDDQIQQKSQTASVYYSSIRPSDVVLSNYINMSTASRPQLTIKSTSAIEENISSSKLAKNGIISQKTPTQDVVTSSILNIPDILPNAFYDTHSSLYPTYLSSITREVIQIINHSSTSEIQENMAMDISLLNSTLSTEKSDQHHISSSAENFLFSKSEELDFFKTTTQPSSNIGIDNIMSNVSASKQSIVDGVSTKQTDVNDTYWMNNELSPSSTTTKSSTYEHKINKTMVVDGSENTNAEISDEVLSSANQSDLENNKTFLSKIIITEILETSFKSIPDIFITETVDNFIRTSSLDISVTNLHLSTLFLTSSELDTSEYYNQGSSIHPSQSLSPSSVLSSSQVQDNIPDILRFLDTTP